MAKSATRPVPDIEVGLVCDAGTSLAGVHGLTDLFLYASEVVCKRRRGAACTPVRIVHWRVDDALAGVIKSSDSHPDLPHAPTVLIIPGNLRATQQSLGGSPLIPWIRKRQAQGVVIAAVCGGVFLLAADRAAGGTPGHHPLGAQCGFQRAVS